LIKLLLSGKQLLLFIIIAWSLLAFVSYNVLTVSATTEKDDTEKYCNSLSEPDHYLHCDDFDWDGYHPDKQSVDELCDASEDYAKNPKNCDKAYALVEKAEEKAAKEDAICDNEDADTTDIKLCMSEERLDQSAFKIDKDECEEANGEWKKDRCTYYEDEQAEAEEQVIEDWGNTVVSDEEQEKINAEEAEYQQTKHELLAKQYTEEEQEEMTNALEEAANDESNEVSDEPEQEEESDDSEDNSSDEGGDSSDSGDDSSSSDDGGDSGDSSESEE
jgi:hypothetical protein